MNRAQRLRQATATGAPLGLSLMRPVAIITGLPLPLLADKNEQTLSIQQDGVPVSGQPDADRQSVALGLFEQPIAPGFPEPSGDLLGQPAQLPGRPAAIGFQTDLPVGA